MVKYLENKKEIINIAKELLSLKLYPDQKFGWSIVHHPFTNSNNVLINNTILDLLIEENVDKWRKQMLEIIKNSDFFDITMLIEKTYKLTFLKYCLPFLDNKDIAKFFNQNWRLIEYPNNDATLNTYQITQLLLKCKKDTLMNTTELSIYNNLPDQVTVYRGIPNINKNNEHALSWTLDKSIANKFALNFDINGSKENQNNSIVLTKKVNKKDIICYFDDEKEVLINTYNNVCDKNVKCM